LDISVAKLVELKAKRELSNDDIARICGASKQAVSNVFHGRTKSVPAGWISMLISALDLDANYFYRKQVDLQTYTNPDSSNFQTIPLLGRIAAGYNRNSEEMQGEGFVLPSFMLPKKKRCFALRVSGDSMIDAGILDGDICIIENQQNPSLLKNGDIAAFRIDGDATLKYYHKQNGNVWLAPANRNYQPIPLTPNSNAELIGPFVSLLRPPA